MSLKLYKPLLIDSIKASSDLQKQRFIGFDGNYCTNGAKALGISDVEVEKDQFAPVAIFGILLVEAAGIIEQGKEITSDNDGRAISLTAGSFSNGFSLDSAEAGEIIRIVRGI